MTDMSFMIVEAERMKSGFESLEQAALDALAQ
jgi:hypothetical protein